MRHPPRPRPPRPPAAPGSRARAARWLGAGALAGLLCTAPTTGGAAGPPGPAATGTSCGRAVLPRPGGGTWRCTLDDVFDGGTLDPTRWQAQSTATSGYTTGAGPSTVCYGDDPRDVAVGGGVLRLTVRRLAAPTTCADPTGAFRTRYTGGMVSTVDRFAQAYGLFEVRAKLPSAIGRGLQETFWLWPAGAVTGRWPAGGEIDFAEFYGDFPALDVPYVHYDAAGADPAVTTDHCRIGRPGRFNTYFVLWTRRALTIGDDGTVCLTDRWHPAAPQRAPSPFDRPFSVVLTGALGLPPDSARPGVTPLPATTEVAWVRAWS